MLASSEQARPLGAFTGGRPIYVIDFETYWDKDYTLSKMPTAAYINDARFEAQCLGIGRRADADLRAGDMLALERPSRQTILDAIPELHPDHPTGCVLVAHHAPFDGAILSQRYHLAPVRWLDTRLLAGYVLGMFTSASLNQVATYLGFGGKSDYDASQHASLALLDTKGRHFDQFSLEEREQLGTYCLHDVSLTNKLLATLTQQTKRPISLVQYTMMDWTVRMATQPKLCLSPAALQARLDTLNAKRRALLAEAKSLGLNATIMGSNPKFRQWLLDQGLAFDQLPTKASKATGKSTDAFAKNDLPFLALATSHPSETIRQGCKLRLKFKSDFERKRTEAYLNFVRPCATPEVPWPVGITYAGARATCRMSGNDFGGGNPQNLSRGSELRASVIVPQGATIVTGDSKQLELRVGLFMAGEHEAHKLLAAGDDLYQHTADRYQISRHAGKTVELQLLYGTGAARLQQQLNLTSDEHWSLDQCQALVNSYRAERTGVVQAWQRCAAFQYQQDADLYLPNERFILRLQWENQDLYVSLANAERCETIIQSLLIYPDLKPDNEGQWSYDTPKGRRSLYPAKLWQNFDQALSYRAIEQQAVAMGARPAAVIHDELVYVVPAKHVEAFSTRLLKTLSTTPDALRPLVLAGEIGTGDNYLEAK